MKKLLDIVKPIVPKRSNLPILQRVALFNEDGFLTLMATDLEITVRVTSEIAVDCPLGINVHFAQLEKIIKALKNQDIQFTQDDDNGYLYINGFRLPTVPNMEFPAMPDLSGIRHTFSADLSTGIAHTLPFVSKDEFRPTLTGVYFQMYAGAFDMVATDGHILVLHPETLEDNQESYSFIVPPQFLTQVKKHKAHTFAVTEGVNAGFIRTEIGNITLVSRLIEGKFPTSYKKCIEDAPHEENRLEIHPKELLPVLQNALIASPPVSKEITFDIYHDQYTVYADNYEEGLVYEKVLEASARGEERPLCVDGEYLQRILKTIEGITAWKFFNWNMNPEDPRPSLVTLLEHPTDTIMLTIRPKQSVPDRFSARMNKTTGEKAA